MAEYIEREAFIESQQHLYCENCARRKDGKGKFVDGWQCSLCGGYMPSETNFCPNCGAVMMEES